MMKIKSNPINIAPFVDVLLVLFVILVVAARFDGPGKDEINKLNMLVEEQKKKIALLESKKPEKPVTAKVVEKVIAIPTTPAKTKIIEKALDDTNKIGTLQDKIATLEKELSKAKSAVEKLERPGGGSVAQIIFGTNGKILVNEVAVSEEFVYTLLKTARPDISVGWIGGGKEASLEFKKYARETLGYGRE